MATVLISHYVFRGNFAEIEGVIFPQPYRERSGPRVLTMRYIHGTASMVSSSGMTARAPLAPLVTGTTPCAEV